MSESEEECRWFLLFLLVIPIFAKVKRIVVIRANRTDTNVQLDVGVF